MIEYKLDQKTNSVATAHIKDMDAILREITTTYEIMLEVVDQQEAALSSPSINSFRKDLQNMIEQAMELSTSIVDNSQKLVVISEHASKQLVAIEDNFSSAIEKHSIKAAVTN